MRFAPYLTPLLAAFALSCRSDDLQERPETPPSAETVEARPAPQPAAQAPVEAAAPRARAPQGQEDGLAEESERVARRQEQRAFLLAEHLRQGDERLERADLQGALTAYASALEIDRTSQEAREKLRRVEGLMGATAPSAADLLSDATDREIVRRAQARIAAEDASLRGDQALRAGDYDAAIEAYREAELVLRYHPLIATDSLDERIVRGKLDDAVALQAEARRAQAESEAESARAAREAREREEREYREQKLRTLYAEADAAFLNENYARAEALLQQVLLEDPGNPAAEELLENARNARHAKAVEENRRDYREQWIRTFEELDTMDVIQIDTLVFDDLKRWSEVSERRPLEFSDVDPQGTREREVVLERLDQVRFAPNFGTSDGDGAPLTEVATFLQNLTGINFLVSRRVREDLEEERSAVRLPQLPERSVLKVLDLIAETSEEVRWRIRDGVVEFVVREELRGGQVLRTYEVNDLIRPPPDFPGREINVLPSGGIPVPDEEIPEREFNVITEDSLDGLIRSNIAPDSWNDDTANAMRIVNGTLVVSQTPEVHAQIVSLLEDLREASSLMVDIQARFLKVEDNFLEEIGVDWRGLGDPGPGSNQTFNDFGDPSSQLNEGAEIGDDTSVGGFYDDQDDGDIRARVQNLYDLGLNDPAQAGFLGDPDVLTAGGGLSLQWTYLDQLQVQMILRAVSKSSRVEIVTAPRITLYNTARGNLSVLNQVAYVADFDVEIAQAASIGDPIIGVVQDGVILDVRPVISADRRFITLELRPTVAELRRPIREVTTTLGSQNSVTIQLPELDIQRVRTSLPMPDGGTILLGGLKVSDKQDLQTGVPILNKIPIVSFFFSRKGNYVSNRKLLVLLNANIVIPQELEPTEAQLPRSYSGL